MRTAAIPSAVAAMLLALVTAARAADSLQPEIPRDMASPQAVGQLHTLRNIPEACVRLEGQFTGEAKTPYAFGAVKRDPCAQRAGYVAASTLKKPPGVKSGWILNDRISVPRADAPACIAVVEVWRRAGNSAPPTLDPQGRSRLYLDKPQQPDAIPVYTAVLQTPKGCR